MPIGALLAGLAILLTPPAIPHSPAATPTPAATVSVTPSHVMVIVEENRSAETVIGSVTAPFVNSLAARYGIATRAYGQSHPSLPNYLELISGSTYGITDDGTGYRLSGPTLVNQLSDSDVDWRAYMDAMPSACDAGAGGGGYAKKHDPFMYFAGITDNSSMCSWIVPFGQFAADLGADNPPAFVFVVPSLCHDGHDCSTSLMDSWLSANLAPVLASAWFAQHGVVIVTGHRRARHRVRPDLADGAAPAMTMSGL